MSGSLILWLILSLHTYEELYSQIDQEEGHIFLFAVFKRRIGLNCMSSFRTKAMHSTSPRSLCSFWPRANKTVAPANRKFMNKNSWKIAEDYNHEPIVDFRISTMYFTSGRRRKRPLGLLAPAQASDQSLGVSHSQATEELTWARSRTYPQFCSERIYSAWIQWRCFQLYRHIRARVWSHVPSHAN